MRKITKYLVVFAILGTIPSGCSLFSGKTGDNYHPSQTNSVMQAGFNEEVYVWEGFVFSTNKVQDVK